MVANVGKKLLYFARELEVCVNPGMKAVLADLYVTDLLSKGYDIIDSAEDFCLTGKTVAIVGSDEHFCIEEDFMFFNSGTDQFTPEMEELFNKCNLKLLGLSLLFEDKTITKKSTGAITRGQLLIINFNFSLRNCTDDQTIEGIHHPALTKKQTEGLREV